MSDRMVNYSYQEHERQIAFRKAILLLATAAAFAFTIGALAFVSGIRLGTVKGGTKWTAK